MIFKTRFNLLN
ncbi:hypothetical protein VCHENC02_5940, partial [Vibrio harveyi]